jgi:hypothetical protein
MTFLLAELGTSGSLDGQQRLVVKGRFAPKVFEGILRRYVSKSFTFGCFGVVLQIVFLKLRVFMTVGFESRVCDGDAGGSEGSGL